MNAKVYKCCAVPLCKNTTIKTPNKLFVYVPHGKAIRKKWFNLARRYKTVCENSPTYFCEDHFDLPNDMENYMQYHVMGTVSQVRMKPGCVPTKFECQPGRKKNTEERPYIAKKRRKALIEECEKDLGNRNKIKKQSKVRGTTSKQSKGSSLEAHGFSWDTYKESVPPLVLAAFPAVHSVLESPDKNNAVPAALAPIQMYFTVQSKSTKNIDEISEELLVEEWKNELEEGEILVTDNSDNQSLADTSTHSSDTVTHCSTGLLVKAELEEEEGLLAKDNSDSQSLVDTCTHCSEGENTMCPCTSQRNSIAILIRAKLQDVPDEYLQKCFNEINDVLKKYESKANDTNNN